MTISIVTKKLLYCKWMPANLPASEDSGETKLAMVEAFF
jgi:hypothetical protein